MHPHCERCENDPAVAWTSYTGDPRTGLWTCDICGQPAGTLDGEAEAEAPAEVDETTPLDAEEHAHAMALDAEIEGDDPGPHPAQDPANVARTLSDDERGLLLKVWSGQAIGPLNSEVRQSLEDKALIIHVSIAEGGSGQFTTLGFGHAVAEYLWPPGADGAPAPRRKGVPRD